MLENAPTDPRIRCMKIRTLAAPLGLALLLLAGNAGAQLAAPGLGLSRPDLADVSFSDYFGEVKGAKIRASVASFVTLRGILAANAGSQSAQPVCIANCFDGSPSFLGETLVPPRAAGGIFVTAVIGTVYLRAELFEPDKVKRKSSAKEDRVQLKQSKGVGIMLDLGINIPTTYSTYYIASVEGCKAQADIRVPKTGTTQTGRFKLSCKKDALDAFLDNFAPFTPESLPDFLASVGLKPKLAFDVVAEDEIPGD
jgi:hypothetical protein